MCSTQEEQHKLYDLIQPRALSSAFKKAFDHAMGQTLLISKKERSRPQGLNSLPALEAQNNLQVIHKPDLNESRTQKQILDRRYHNIIDPLGKEKQIGLSTIEGRHIETMFKLITKEKALAFLTYKERSIMITKRTHAYHHHRYTQYVQWRKLRLQA